MPDPYASHVPFLQGLGRGSGDLTKRVLELGSGVYSTSVFLDRECFPYVTQVVSVEHNQGWADKVRAACPDERLTLIVVPEPIETYLDTIALDFDMIFVDSSDCWENRVKTIEYLGRRVTTQNVVIHDFEHQFYQDAAQAFPNKIVDTTRVPHTALVWK